MSEAPRTKGGWFPDGRNQVHTLILRREEKSDEGSKEAMEGEREINWCSSVIGETGAGGLSGTGDAFISVIFPARGKVG